MKPFCVSILFCLLTIERSPTQVADLPPFTNNSTNQLYVKLSLPGNNNMRHAPEKLDIFASVQSFTPARKGDTLTVNFFAGTNFLGSDKAVWHQGVKPDPHAHKPQAMVIVTAGFSPATMVWTNPPPGNYLLTATAVGAGVAADSEPVNLTILP